MDWRHSADNTRQASAITGLDKRLPNDWARRRANKLAERANLLASHLQEPAKANCDRQSTDITNFNLALKYGVNATKTLRCTIHMHHAHRIILHSLHRYHKSSTKLAYRAMTDVTVFPMFLRPLLQLLLAALPRRLVIESWLQLTKQTAGFDRRSPINLGPA